MSEDVPVTFQPSGTVTRVPMGTTVLDAARKAGVIITATCGGRTTCGSCCVKVLEGRLAPPDPEEAAALVRAGNAVRLACRARVVGPVTVRPLVNH